MALAAMHHPRPRRVDYPYPEWSLKGKRALAEAGGAQPEPEGSEPVL